MKPGDLVRIHGWYEDYCRIERLKKIEVSMWDAVLNHGQERNRVGYFNGKDIGVICAITNGRDDWNKYVFVLSKDTCGWMLESDLQVVKTRR